MSTAGVVAPQIGFDARRCWSFVRSLLRSGAERKPARAFSHSDCGLKTGDVAPDFHLPRVGSRACSLADYAGARVLLVFVEPGCVNDQRTAEELNRIQHSGDLQVLAILRCQPHEAALWADDVLAAFPVLVSSDAEVSINYMVDATPFAYVVDEQGRIAESGEFSM